MAATAEGEVAAESPVQHADVLSDRADAVDTMESTLVREADQAVQAANAAAAREVANGVQDGPASRAAAEAARRSSGVSNTPIGRMLFRRCLADARRAEAAVEAAEEAYRAMDNGVRINPLLPAMFANDSGPV